MSARRWYVSVLATNNFISKCFRKKLDELGRQLLEFSKLVPSGMVVFFVSYDYLDRVVNHFKKNNTLGQLNEHKQVFYEPKLSSDCDRVFSEYTKCIRVICFETTYCYLDLSRWMFYLIKETEGEFKANWCDSVCGCWWQDEWGNQFFWRSWQVCCCCRPSICQY